jgi:transcriptional regulator with XRE-family HTH domain
VTKPRHSRLRRAELARAREAAGLTQEAFAARAGVEVSTVVRWESGCTTPLPGKRPRIARALGVELHDLERLLSPETPPVHTAGREGPDDGRLAAIAQVREEVAKLTAEYDARPVMGLVVKAAGLLGRVEALRACAGSASGWRRDLDIAEAEAALLIGRLLWDAAGRRDSSAAEEYFDRAARRAGQAGDSVLQVTAALHAGFVGLYGGDPRAGVRRCVQAAVIAAPVSEALFALARLHAAEGHALLGHAAEADRALTTARGAMAAISPDDPAPSACSPRTYQRLAGSAYLALGRHAEARVALTEAAIRYEPGKVLALVLGQLALACLGEGDRDAAVHHMRTAIELAEASQSAAAIAVALRAGREIVRSADGVQPEVREIVDKLLMVLAA